MAGVTTTPPIVAPAAYANAEDLTLYWRAPDAPDRANYILKLASNRLRLMAKDIGVDLDAQVNADEVYFMNVQYVVMEASKRALQTDVNQAPSETWQQTAGPYSENIKYSNPAGDLYFKKAELSTIGLNGNPQLYSISTSRTDIYGS